MSLSPVLARIAARTAASSLELLLQDEFNVQKLVLIVDNAFQENRAPTDAELASASRRLDRKINALFGPAPRDAKPARETALIWDANGGDEPNDKGSEH